MKLKYALFVMLSLILLTSFPLLGCNNQPSAKEQAAQEFFASASEYLHEFNSLTTLTETRIEEASASMRSGELDTRELFERIGEIYFAEATTIEFLDSLPEYSSLRAVMWEDGKPPKLFWDPDDSTYHIDFKEKHVLAFIKVGDKLNELEKELGIKLQYRPTWHTETTTDNKTQENK